MKSKLFLIIFIVIVFLLSACSYGGGSEEVSSDDATSDTSSEETETTVNEDGKFEPAVEITTARPVGSDYVFINGENIHQNIHNKWAEESLGIKIKDLWESADNSAYHTQLRLSLTSDEELPDAFIVQDPILIDDLIQSGQVMDISEAFDQYASDRLKEVYEENSYAFNQVTYDGKVMGLPIFTAGDGTSPVLWIRQDWLDHLGLEPPKKIEEFESVMEAFTNDDPDGNGVDDTFGFSFSGRNGFNNWMSDVSFVFGAYTGKYIPGTYLENEEGSLVYSSVQPGIKEGLNKLRDWYSKGYLDQELAVLDEVKATEAFIQGKSGMIAAPFWAEGWPLGDVKSTNPDAVLEAYSLPVGQDGKSARFMNSLNEGKVMMFRKGFEHMDAFFHYFDKIYDRIFETGEFEHGFFEGYDYAMVDGEAVYDPTKFPTPLDQAATPGKYTLFWNIPEIPLKSSEDHHFIYEGNEPETSAQKVIAQSSEAQIKAGALNYEMRDINTPSLFLGAPTETMKSRGENLETLELETFAKIIYGEYSIDKFDEFVEEYYSKGGKDIEKEVNEWYQSINK
ncbi:extracellular solute-binding protein [Gracilibacillus dipsosauri]|uniref:ABC transporter substrate-binding protein n=1 Tax=Gracilibacillus dipsosauri TaxID=178340 RepID=A0A317L184_9BACI|nr:extracellular solute-binding protein [Gracilibacillus dipsosauri]PWU69591.1 ABC transporter substrate-binding protein [Gracilibacillus dipsosauri]